MLTSVDISGTHYIDVVVNTVVPFHSVDNVGSFLGEFSNQNSGHIICILSSESVSRSGMHALICCFEKRM